ncbi:MAG TPA: glycosyltransferase, partial [Bacillales bacterium]|nr:glycosyltransferase [Bacillales bacterium]
GNYYAFSVDGERMGWIHEDAIDIVKEPTIIKERAVARIAQICLKENDDVWDRPFGLTDAEKTVKNAKFLDGSIVHVDKEATTPAGTSSHVVKNGSPLGWLHNRSLVVRDLLGIEVDGRFIPEPSRENVNFVNVGRLSPEKGQDNLIRAFARFHRRHANSKLYILGNGPLKPDLQALAKELDVDDAVYLLGQLENPFAFMRKCDCFVLSSHYEGQPMVLLEAMTLGMNIVATDIVANRTVLDDGSYGLLVKDSVDGLVKGMTQVAERNVPMKKFDYETYNLTAMATFYEKLQSS